LTVTSAVTYLWETREDNVLHYIRNMMAHAQKPDFVFRRKGRVHLNRLGGGGGSVQSTAGSRGVRISGSNAGYTVFRGSVKGTGYPLHSPVSPSLPLPYVAVFHHISTGVYLYFGFIVLKVSKHRSADTRYREDGGSMLLRNVQAPLKDNMLL
jgi:hypothetical protein